MLVIYYFIYLSAFLTQLFGYKIEGISWFGGKMAIRYNKLWNLVRKNKMKKKDLQIAANISAYIITKLNNDEPVSMEVMLRLCKLFHCAIGDVMEVVEE